MSCLSCINMKWKFCSQENSFAIKSIQLFIILKDIFGLMYFLAIDDVSIEREWPPEISFRLKWLETYLQQTEKQKNQRLEWQEGDLYVANRQIYKKTKRLRD